jgi:PAS domain S-box-containing protein
VRQRRPIIHDDYASAPGRKGLPPGHAAVLRELVVPVFRHGRIVSVLGVGNKPADYTEEDVALVSRFADLAWDIAERRQVQERLHESDARFAAAFERAPMMMTLTRLEDGRLLSVNQRFVEVSGFTAAEAVGQTSVALGWVDAGERARMAEALRAEGRVAGFEVGVKTKAGRPLRARFWGEVIAVGGERCLLAIAQDVTTELQLQQQLAQAQKMESVGRLAGGVAHDFNNMLAVILGHTDLLLQRDGLDDDLREGLEEIGDAARRSAVVTRQLLAFARKQTVQPRVLDLDETLGGMLKMLRRLIGEDIDLTWSPGSGEARVRIDPSQVDQLLANLCVNSRDAIDGVGRISISTAVVAADEALRARHPELGEGPWVRLSVRDDGAGIRPELLPRVFEPFFTTKEQGRGTGLGLATVYGIVRQNGGAVDVESVVGVGTAFHLWLPSVAPAAPTPAVVARPPAPRAAETVQLVEDEPAVLRHCADQLRHLGYRVLQANGPGEAIKLAGLHAGQVQLLMTDVVMPGMSGKDLATMLLLGHPGMRCLFMSGYTSETISRHGVGGGGAVFLQKPFDAAALAVKVREALDGVAPAVAPPGVGR